MYKVKNKSLKFWIRSSVCGGLFLVMAVFGFINMNAIISGVSIKATLEEDKATDLTKIVGSAKNASFLALNGREIFIDKNGAFSETMSLPYGYSVITLSAEDKFGKSVQKQIEVYKKEQNVVALKTSVVKY